MKHLLLNTTSVSYYDRTKLQLIAFKLAFKVSYSSIIFAPLISSKQWQQKSLSLRRWMGFEPSVGSDCSYNRTTISLQYRQLFRLCTTTH